MANKDETRACIRRQLPDVVVLDLGIPGPIGANQAHGLDSAHELKARTEPVPIVIAFSGYHRLRREAAVKVGCDAFVLKPRVDELLKILRGALAARETDAARKRPA